MLDERNAGLAAFVWLLWYLAPTYHSPTTPHTQAGAGSRAGNRYTACTHTQAVQNGPGRNGPQSGFWAPLPFPPFLESQKNFVLETPVGENDVQHLFVADTLGPN